MEPLVKVCKRRRMKILVLLHLFVVNAAADCQKPVTSGSHVFSNSALLLNNFREGSQVLLECANGYQSESGSGIMVCTNGNWTKPDLTCKVKDCGPPKPEPNVKFNISEGTLFRARLRVYCDKGYQLSGSSFRRCYANGWAGRTNCTIVTCDKPGDLTNGRNLWNSEDRPKYGESIQYLCNEGFVLVGTEKVVCTETGKYDSEPPECKGVTKEDGVINMTATPTGVITDSPAATNTPKIDTTIQTSAAATILYTAQEGEGVSASVSSTTWLQDLNEGIVDTNKDTGYIAVILGIFGIVVVGVIIGLCSHKFLLRRKGSYDTREGTKPERLCLDLA